MLATLPASPFHAMGNEMPRKPKPPTATVRVYKDVAELVEIITQAEGIHSADLLSDLLRPQLIERADNAANTLRDRVDKMLSSHSTKGKKKP